MAGQKVTFYNEVSIERNSSSADIKIPGNASSLSPNGIYFTPNTDTLHNDAAPHIVQGQYIYTLGSKVLEDNKTDAITIVQGDTDMSNTHFETNTAALVVTKKSMSNTSSRHPKIPNTASATSNTTPAVVEIFSIFFISMTVFV